MKKSRFWQAIPRGFWKRLHEVLLQYGLKPIPAEAAAYYLPGPENEIQGLLGTHVDDILWTGNERMDNVMNSVQQHFRFGKIEGNEFKFCSCLIKQQEDGVYLSSPNVMDRVIPGAKSKPEDTLRIRKTPWHGVTEQPPAVPLPGPNVNPEPNEKSKVLASNSTVPRHRKRARRHPSNQENTLLLPSLCPGQTSLLNRMKKSRFWQAIPLF